MELGIKKRVAFVAGSSQGLGYAVARELAKEGCELVICSRNKEKIEKAAKELRQHGKGKVLAIVADLSNQKDRESAISETLKEYNHVDILVTNTGGPPAGKFEDFQKSDWDKAYELLLYSAVGLIRGFLPGMKSNNWGRIIAITSQAVKQPVDNLILSNSVRASVVGLLKTLAGELGPFGITCNNVMPGYMDTERLQQLMASNPSFSDDLKNVPIGRIGRPEEFAAAIAFLASERASYITGVSLAVDGGRIKSVM